MEHVQCFCENWTVCQSLKLVSAMLLLYCALLYKKIPVDGTVIVTITSDALWHVGVCPETFTKLTKGFKKMNL